MRRLVWPTFLIVVAYLSVSFLHSTYNKHQGFAPGGYDLFTGREFWLLTHLAGGALTIVLGPLQLSRQQLEVVRPIHRWSGRLYLLGMLIACVGAAGLITTSPAPSEIRIAFAMTMLAWVSTAIVAAAAVLKKHIAAHRKWMIRNYLVTLAPVIFRMLLSMTLALGFAPSSVLIATLLWASWSLPLLAFEALVRIPGLRSLGGTSRSQVAS